MSELSRLTKILVLSLLRILSRHLVASSAIGRDEEGRFTHVDVKKIIINDYEITVAPVKKGD